MSNSTLAWANVPHLDFPDVVERPLAFALWMVGIVATMVLVKLQFDGLCLDYKLRDLPSAPGSIPVCVMCLGLRNARDDSWFAIFLNLFGVFSG
jgi:hypothetical protein